MGSPFDGEAAISPGAGYARHGCARKMAAGLMAAGLLATQLVGEPITPNLMLGLVAVFAGIWIATSEVRPASP